MELDTVERAYRQEENVYAKAAATELLHTIAERFPRIAIGKE